MATTEQFWLIHIPLPYTDRTTGGNKRAVECPTSTTWSLTSATANTLISKSAVDNTLNRFVKVDAPFHFARAEGYRLPFATVLPRFGSYQRKATSQPGVACEVIHQENVGMYSGLKASALVSTQTHLQKAGVFWKHIRLELQNVNDSYRLTIFISGGDISDGANYRSFRRDVL